MSITTQDSAPQEVRSGTFDPDRLAYLEVAGLRAYYDHKWLRAFQLIIELMHEQFVLALPMKPLCSENCKGLCPSCGTNLNKASCECAPVWKDPRLAALEGLLQKKES